MNKKILKKILPGFIIIFWLVMISLLILQQVVFKNKTAGYKTFLSKDKLLSDSWMGIYFNSLPVGFVHSAIEPFMIKKGKSGYRIINRTFMNLFIMRKRNKVWFNAQAIVDADYQLVNFDFDLTSGTHTINVFGEMLDKQTLKVKIVSQGNISEKKIILPKDQGFLIASIISPFSSFGSLEIGNNYNLMVFNPFSLALEPLEVNVLDQEIIVHDNQDVKAYRVKSKYRGIEQTAWVNQDGEILKQETGLGWVLIKESPEAATRVYSETAKSEIELMQMVSIAANITLPNKPLKVLNINLKNLPDDFDLKSQRQKILNDQDNIKTLQIRAEKINQEQCLALPINEFNDLKHASAFIQADAPEIKALAAKIINKEKNSYLAAVKINDWLFKNIAKVPVVSIPSAVDVLKTREGDCNEHSVLFAALARSIGIPTKINVGLVYSHGRFYYHAWVSVYIGVWLDMDPTFGQNIADAGHIKLLEGDIRRQLDIIRVLGKIELEVINFQ
ncbi:MAG: lasso peptide biosynthesis protein [Candidatus Omnitrophica bacterium]|nr:lasso peptide biosynthesis protein [Candidatus Omnitrophota bacterium]